MAQGGAKEGMALYDAVQAGGRFADYKEAFGDSDGRAMAALDRSVVVDVEQAAAV